MNAVYYLVVAIYMVVAPGQYVGPTDTLQYNKADWPTLEACQAALKTDAIQQSLNSLRAAAKQAYGANVIIAYQCSQDGKDGQPVNVPTPEKGS